MNNGQTGALSFPGVQFQSNEIPIQTEDQPQASSPNQTDEISTLISAHFSLIGERLKEISRNIENCVREGQNPNIDRSLDILLDTTLYSSSILLNLFQYALPVGPDQQSRSESEIDKELTQLAIYHLTTAAINPHNKDDSKNQTKAFPSNATRNSH